MIRIFAVLLCVMMLTGCFLAEPFERTNQTMRAQTRAAEASVRYQASSDKYEGEFVKCMKEYGKVKSSDGTSLADLADAALGACDVPLKVYEMSRRTCYGNENVLYDRPGAETKYRVQHDVDILIAEGKRATISEAVAQRAGKMH